MLLIKIIREDFAKNRIEININRGLRFSNIQAKYYRTGINFAPNVLKLTAKECAHNIFERVVLTINWI